MMSKTRKITLGLLIAIFCLALVATVSLSYVEYVATATSGDVVAWATTTSDKCNHTWLHSDATVLNTKGETLSQDGKYYLDGNVELTNTLYISGNVELCLNGYALQAATPEEKEPQDEFDDIPGSGSAGKYFRIVQVYSKATFTLYDCSNGDTGLITGGVAFDGGGVYVSSGGTFVMNGGNISGNAAEHHSNDNGGTPSGGGVYVWGSFVMNGGKITNNRGKNGGGVYVGKSFTMNGGEISGNDDCGVFVSNGHFIMNGGVITNNQTSGYGGGVYVSNTIYTTSHITLNGSSKIYGNIDTYPSDKPSNVYLYNKADMVVDGDGKQPPKNGPIYIGKLNEDARIGVSAYNKTGTFSDDWKDDYGDPSQYFFADDNDKSISLNSYGQLTIVNGHVHHGVTFQPLTSDTNITSGNYYLTKDIAHNITISENVHLCLNGYMITGSGTGSVITVNSGASFSLFDCCFGDICENNEHKHMYAFEEKGPQTFALLMTGGLITGGNATSGGGVLIQGGTFTMYGGTISDNKATNGGGIYIDGAKKTIKDGGIIEEFYVPGKFTMRGGNITCNNASFGGGVYITSLGTFEMVGGAVTKNTATHSGGVYVADEAFGSVDRKETFTAELIISGAPVISGNKLTSGTENNVALGFNRITIAGALKDGARVGVTLSQRETGTFASGWTDSYGSPKDYFVADEDGKCINLTGNPKLSAHSVTTWGSSANEHWYECSNCGEQSASTSHNWNNWTSADSANHERACADGCGVANQIESHNLTWKTSQTEHWQECSNATCDYASEHHVHNFGENYHVDSTENKHYQVCSETNCSYKTYSAHVSDNGKITQQATCSVEGVKTYSCVNCNTVMSTESIDKVNHIWGNGVVTKEPTATKDGVLTYTCESCGAKKTAPISATGPANDKPTTPGGNTTDNSSTSGNSGSQGSSNQSSKSSNGNKSDKASRYIDWYWWLIGPIVILILVLIAILLSHNKKK